MEYLRIVARIIGCICDKNELPGEQSTERVDCPLDVTRESRALAKKKKEPDIEPAGAIRKRNSRWYREFHTTGGEMKDIPFVGEQLCEVLITSGTRLS